MRLLPLWMTPFLALGCHGPGPIADQEPAQRAATPAASGRSFPAQPGWVEEAPSSSMRLKQFRLPGEGEARAAELVVFSFPGGGGSVEANVERWCSQFEQPDGGSSKDVALLRVVERDGLRIHRLELGGTYVAETAPGSGERLNEPGWRMVGAVVEGAGATCYVKCTGPDATLARWRESIDEFLARLHP